MHQTFQIILFTFISVGNNVCTYYLCVCVKYAVIQMHEFFVLVYWLLI